MKTLFTAIPGFAEVGLRLFGFSLQEPWLLDLEVGFYVNISCFSALLYALQRKCQISKISLRKPENPKDSRWNFENFKVVKKPFGNVDNSKIFFRNCKSF